MADDMNMKDIGDLNTFMFNNGNGLNIMDMMENGPTTNSNTNNVPDHSDHIKQENNMLPPDIVGGNGHHSNYNSLPPPNNVAPGYGFSLSASPPQQSPMFMDSINPNNNHNMYGLDNGHNGGHPSHSHNNQFGDAHLRNNHNNNSHGHNQFGDGLIKTRLLSATNNGANTIRPRNLPHLRGNSSNSSQSNMDNGTNINNLNSNVHYLKHSKSDPNHSNMNHLNNMNHILTPFDYPLSNPTINTSSSSTSAHSQSLSTTPTKNSTNYNHFSLSSSLLNIPQHLTQNQHPSFPHSNSSYGAGNGYKHGNDGYNDDQNHFNFLWWYPEVKFLELDPHLVPIP